MLPGATKRGLVNGVQTESVPRHGLGKIATGGADRSKLPYQIGGQGGAPVLLAALHAFRILTSIVVITARNLLGVCAHPMRVATHKAFRMEPRPVGVTACRSAFDALVALIRSRGADPQVAAPLVFDAVHDVDTVIVVPDTVRHVARVADRQSVSRPVAGGEHPCIGVDEAATAIDGELPVSIPVTVSRPRPARVSLFYVPPEPLISGYWISRILVGHSDSPPSVTPRPAPTGAGFCRVNYTLFTPERAA